jgi:hypothetical protein
LKWSWPTTKCYLGTFLGSVSISRGCLAQLFVRGKLVRLFTVFVSSIEARRAIDVVLSSREITVNTARAAAAFMFMFNIAKERRNLNKKCVVNE